MSKGRVTKKKVDPLGKRVRFMWERGDVVISKAKKVLKGLLRIRS
jgi:hypothetical protein